MVKTSPQIYQFKVTLKGIRPPIWRRIQVASNTTLYELHTILQIAMGWEGYHLHAFTYGGQTYGDPQDDEDGSFGTKNEKRYRLNQLGLEAGARLDYEYDFGESWDHLLELEKIFPPEEGVEYPRCVKGKRAGPPEDCGGVRGYQEMIAIAADPSHPDHEERMKWLPEDFDPEAFDLQGINESLGMVHGRRERQAAREAGGEEAGELPLEKLADPKRWESLMIRENEIIAQDLPLRRDTVALLEYLRDNKVTGTQSTGNFPLKALVEIAARMVNPPVLESRDGDQVSRARSEIDVWPIFFRHLVAAAAGLIDGGAGRRWRLTKTGTEFLTVPPLIQVWILFASWWSKVDWSMAFPFSGPAEGLPAGFENATRDELLAIPSPAPVSFATFANRLAAVTNYSWPAPDAEIARFILHRSIETMVIDPLVDFEAVATVYEPNPDLPGGKILSAFRLTALGKGLLSSIK